MKNKKLIKLAGKAIGVKVKFAEDGYPFFYDETFYHFWNPLEDDGDALRLALALDISVCVYHDCSQPKPWLRVEDSEGNWVFVDPDKFGKCKFSATRRAIVEAAAFIGSRK